MIMEKINKVYKFDTRNFLIGFICGFIVAMIGLNLGLILASIW